MPVSQNGYPANNVGLTSVKRIPDTRREIRLAEGELGWLLRDFAAWFDKNIETIDNDGILDDWGYAERPVRGGTDLSNHASGTALDLNAPEHPLGVRGTFSRAKAASIRRELRETYEGTIRWGGDYVGRADEMHFEIIADRETVVALAKKLRRQRRLEAVRKIPAKIKRRVLATVVLASVRKQAENYLAGKPVSERGGVKVIQRQLNQRYGFNIKVDGFWGRETNQGWRHHEKKSGPSGRPGVPDTETLVDLSRARFLVR